MHGDKKKYIGSYFKDSIQWDKFINWQNITYYLIQRKKLEQNQNTLPQKSRHSISVDKVGLLNLGLDINIESLIARKLFSEQNSKKPEIDENAVKLMVIDDINIYLLHIELDHSKVKDILVSIAEQYIHYI